MTSSEDYYTLSKERNVSRKDKIKVPKNLKTDKSASPKKQRKFGCHHKQGMKERQALVWHAYPAAALEFQDGMSDAVKILAFDAKSDWLDAGCPGLCPGL